MNEDFVTYEIAKKLKKKGFKKKCLAHYDCYGVLLPSTYIETWDARNCEDLDYTFFLRSFNEGLLHTIGVVYDAPTIARVLKWLREKHYIHFEVVATAYGYNLIISNTPNKGATDRYCSYAKDDGSNNCGAWDNYDDCVMYGIGYTLDNLI